MSDEPEYHIEMPYWIDGPAYSDRDRDMFVNGAEFQMIYEIVKRQKWWEGNIHKDNESRIKMMCGKLNLKCEITSIDGYDEWSYCLIGAFHWWTGEVTCWHCGDKHVAVIPISQLDEQPRNGLECNQCGLMACWPEQGEVSEENPNEQE